MYSCRRLDAAEALSRAAAAGDAGRFGDARAALEAAARRVQASAAGQEGYGRALVADLQARVMCVQQGRIEAALRLRMG